MDKIDPKSEILSRVIADHDAIKSLDYAECALLAAALREQIIKTCADYGGHLSSNLGVVELTIALHRVFDLPKDKLIFDVGHQAYAHKILTGRSLENLGDIGKTSCFQKRDESPFDPYEAGHSSTSISAVSAFSYARDERKEKYEIIGLIGDASIANGLAFEALNDLGQRKSRAIIVLNDNDMSITQPKGGLSRFFRSVSTSRAYISIKEKMREGEDESKFRKSFNGVLYRIKNWFKRHLIGENMFDNLGFSYIGPFDGHNLFKIEKALRRAKNSSRPIIVHFRTIKGKGYPYSESDQIGYWHSTTPFHIGTGRPKAEHPGLMSWSHYYADLIHSALENRSETRLISASTLKGSGLEKSFALFPTRCIDFGIAEEHALTFAGALSLEGFHPIVSIYSTFLQRAYDELFHDCARLKSNMTIILDRACLDGKLGNTHQGIYDEAFLKGIPGVTLAMAADKAIARQLLAQSFDKKGVFIIRCPRELVDERHEPPANELPYLRFRYEGRTHAKKLAIVAVGPKEKELLKLLEKNFLDAELIDPVYLFPFQKDNVLPLLKYENLIIYDAYGTRNGFAETLSSALGEYGYQGKLFIRAISNEFVGQGKYEQQLAEFGLLPSQVLDLAKSVLGK